MAEYIEREAVCYRLEKQESIDGQPRAIRRARRIVADFHAADVRPVVLCRDCDNWNEWDSAGRKSFGNYRCSCAYWTVEDGPTYYTAETDFCSYAEKREVEHDRL